MRERSPKEDLYLLVNYQLGYKFASRKLSVAVCGYEVVSGLYTELTEFKYQYEVGSSFDGGLDQSGNSTNRWVIWSEEFEPFFLSNDLNCPVFQYEIYSAVDPYLGDLTPNTFPSQVFVQKNPNGTFQIELRTTQSFNHTKFFLRSWTESTFDLYM